MGIEHPICQAGMYQVAYGRLATGVSKAGGLEIIGCAFMDPEDLRKEIQLVKNKAERPFGIYILFAEIKGKNGSSQGYTQ